MEQDIITLPNDEDQKPKLRVKLGDLVEDIENFDMPSYDEEIVQTRRTTIQKMVE